MEVLLAKVTQQAMNYAIRSGITITSGYAISQCSRFLKTQHGRAKDDLANLQRRLESKIRIISPAIDMIELITARGNTSLESAVTLTKSLRWDIQALGVRLSQAATDEEAFRRKSSKAKPQAQRELELQTILSDMKILLERIEDAVPLISLAITTSGVSLSTNLPAAISPSRLLQASTFLSAGDAQYAVSARTTCQIGPVFTLSIYMLFQGHAHLAGTEEGFRSTMWQEVVHKARVKLLRTTLNHVEDLPGLSSPGGSYTEETRHDKTDDHRSQVISGERRFDEFAYQLLIVEDLDDDRLHTLEDGDKQPGRYDDVEYAGIREIIPIHQVSRIFYADTGKILNIGTDGETNNPVLLLKRDVNAIPPRRMMKDEDDGHGSENIDETELSAQEDINDDFSEVEAQFAREFSYNSQCGEDNFKPSANTWKFPPGLDPDWVAFEVYDEMSDSDSDVEDEVDTPLEDDNDPSTRDRSRPKSLEPDLSSALSQLRLSAEATKTPSKHSHERQDVMRSIHSPANVTPVFQSLQRSSSLPIRTSLSLLEMLIRLTSLQQFQQASHLTINDELLNFFLEESSTTGIAPGDGETRKRVRMEARLHVGFDPYDESPIKRRGENNQHHDDTHDSGYEGLSSELPLPNQRQSHRYTSSSPLRARTPLSPAMSRNTTPLRQLAQRNIKRSQGIQSSPIRVNNYTSGAKGLDLDKVHQSDVKNNLTPEKHDHCAEEMSQNTPLPSVELADV